MKVCVIGGGAAGFFSAIQVKRFHPDADVVLLEKSSKVLSKVRISGGGRCNVTNGSDDIDFLSAAYPRGFRLMKRALWSFNTTDIRDWFEQRGVPLYTQDDGRVFPKSNNSQSIVDALERAVRENQIEIQLKCAILEIEKTDEGFILVSREEKIECEKVIVATGGSPKESGLDWLKTLGHRIVPPVPSLFTFNMPEENISDLMGLSVPMAEVAVQSTKLSSSGPLLITHWGMSGPAILKLSAFGARELAEMQYQFGVRINWTRMTDHEEVRQHLFELLSNHALKDVGSLKAFGIPRRLWTYLVMKAGYSADRKVSELGKKGRNKLVDILTHDVYKVSGKTTFKEEFVTCGGVSLSDIHWDTMESKKAPGLYFAGEVMDVDGITGGFNFQAAWTTAYLAGQLSS